MSNNVSYQLFNKQLSEPKEYNICQHHSCGKYLSFCVDKLESANEVETAFQSQLNLSEYYKGKSVFNAVKKNFMDVGLY